MPALAQSALTQLQRLHILDSISYDEHLSLSGGQGLLCVQQVCMVLLRSLDVHNIAAPYVYVSAAAAHAAYSASHAVVLFSS